MPSLIKKVKRKQAYYYIVQSGRVNGKPRIIWQKYLGTIDAILKRFEQTETPTPSETTLFEAGGVAALFNVASRLGIVDIINQVVPKRDQGPSVGHYILLAAINRALDPSSKLHIGEWYHHTILQRLWSFPEDAFTTQRYWDHMDMVPVEAIEEIQNRITAKARVEFKIDTETLLYDSTNFFTYIDTHNERNGLAKRGHNKQKRSDLLQVNLALLATKDFHIPLFHKAYRGDIPDVKFFPTMAEALLQRHKSVCTNLHASTLMFDKGNLSEANLQELVFSNIHFVAAMKKDFAPDLFETPLDQFEEAIAISGTKFHSSLVDASGRNCLAVVSYSESLFAEQLAALSATMAKCQDKLQELQANLMAWGLGKKTRGKRPQLAQVRTRLKEILAPQHMHEIFKTTLEKHNGCIIFKYSLDKSSLDRITSHHLGRALLLTNRLDWIPPEVIASYRSLSNIEDAFKHMKNRDYLRWQPAFHWTDQKVYVHTLYCVLALLLATLAKKQAHEAGMDVSLVSLLDDLSAIKEVALLYKTPENRVKAHFTLNSMTPRQKKLAELFKIHQILAQG